MDVKEIWPTYIGISHREKLQCSDHSSIYSLLKKISDEGNVTDKDGLGFVTNDYIHQYSELQTLNNWLKDQVHAYTDQIGWDVDKEDLFIANSWGVVSRNGASTHNPHIHANSILSTVYYINAPKGSALLGFINPQLKFKSWCPDYKEKTSVTEGEYHVSPKGGQCVVFRSDVPHLTSRNNFVDDTQLQERICIAYSWNIKNLGKKSLGLRYGL